MIVELPDTSTTEINKKLNELREKTGAVTLGRVLTLVIAPDSDALLEESIEAANVASHEHPSRVIVVMTGDPEAATRASTPNYASAAKTQSANSWSCDSPGHWPATTAASSSRSCYLTSRSWPGGPTSPPQYLRKIHWASWQFVE